jgi:hypothetical protein
MTWIKDLLGITADYDVLRNFMLNRLDLLQRQLDNFDEQFRNRIIQVDVSILETNKKIDETLTKTNLTFNDAMDFFRKGIVKLDKNEVYVIHVAENIPVNQIVELRDLIAELGIQAVVISSEKIHVIKI